MAEKRIVIMVAAVPGYDFSVLADVCARAGADFVEVDRQEPPEDAMSFTARLARLNRRIHDLSGYGWADTRMLPQDASRQNIDRRFEHWVSSWMFDGIVKVWEAAPAATGRPLVIAGDSFAPSMGVLSRLFKLLKLDVKRLFIGLSSAEALAQFKARIPGEVGIPGAPQLWLKHTLLGLYQLLEPGDGHLVRWPTDEAAREDFEAVLSGQKPQKLTPPAAQPGTRGCADHPKAFDLMEGVDVLLADWPALKPAVREARTTALLNSLRATAILYGAAAEAPEKLKRFRIPLPRAAGIKERPVILHYHFFKNAGTSVDAMLKDNFGQLWDSREFQEEKGVTAAVAAWVKERRSIRAFSSHTMTGPVPEIDGVRMFPVVFIRHPIDRVKSAYLFERRQTVENDSTVLAQTSDFARYVETKLSGLYGPAITDFNSTRLATFSPGAGTRLERALAALEALPFVGLVEHFDVSIQRLERLLQAFYPTLVFGKVQVNATRDPALGLKARLDEIRQELGPELYKRLEDANRDDLALFDRLDAFYRKERETMRENI